MEIDQSRVLEALPAMAWISDPNGNVDFVNRRWSEYTGLSINDARGSGWQIAIEPKSLPMVLDRWSAILASGEAGEIEVRLRRLDGQYRWFAINFSPMRDDIGSIVNWYGINTDIDRRKGSEDTLLASERNLGLIINSIPVMAWSARPDGAPEFFNHHYLHYVGLSIGQSKDWEPAGPLSDYWDLTAAVHPDDVDRLTDSWDAILASAQPGEAEVRLRRYDGKYRWFLLRANPLFDDAGKVIRWYGTHTDIHAKKRAEDALKQSEAFLAEGQYLARMGNLSWQVETGRITWSEPLYRIFGFEPGSVVSLERIAARVHPDDIPLMGDMVERANRGEGTFEYQHRIIFPDESVKYLHLIGHRVQSSSSVIEYIGAVLDITQRRRSEDALERARSELAQATRIMSLNALTASIAHEVNQPLSGIITNAGTCLRMLAADPPNVDGARETARRTIRDGNRAADVIARLRALFKKRPAVIEPVNLNDAAVEVVAMLAGDLQRRGIAVRTQLGSGLPQVGGDRVQLQQVIMNLLRNACDAMAEMDQAPRLIVLGTRLGEDRKVLFFVRDKGMGFDPQNAERLFEAFYTTKAEGMGIGLAVSRSIIESHGGSLWAEANPEAGSTFSFDLPEYQAAEALVPSSDSIVAPAEISSIVQRGLS